MNSSSSIGVGIFASGAGSNALKIIEHFSDHPAIHIKAVICNRPDAGVLRHAHKHHIPSLLVTKRLLNNRDWTLRQLKSLEIDHIVLAGFLLLIPEFLVEAYQNRIVNIHPALLPKYGGKGMYGMHVHEAVKSAGETETGITIHMVNEQYDDGQVLFQAKTTIDHADSPEDIAQKVHGLEHRWYPEIIERWISRDDIDPA